MADQGAERLRSIQRLFKELRFDIPTIAQREKVSQAPVEMKAMVAQEKMTIKTREGRNFP